MIATNRSACSSRSPLVSATRWGRVALVLAAAFVVLAQGVLVHGWLADQDTMVSHWVVTNRTPLMTQVLSGLTHIHDTPGVLFLSAVFAAYLAWTNRARWLTLWLWVVPLGMLSNVALKQLIHRPRPSWESALVSVSSSSFPSGHTTGAALFYGVVVACVLRSHCSRAMRIAALAVAIGLIGVVAFSRIYLGVHYLSDVLASVVLASAWLALGVAVDQRMSRKIVP